MSISRLLFPLLFLLQCSFGNATESSVELFTVNVPYGGVVSPKMATAVAKSKVLHIAMLAAVDTLAKQPEMQFLNENSGGITFSPLNIDGFTRKIWSFSAPTCSRSSNPITCTTISRKPSLESLREGLVANRKDIPLLERYVALVQRNEFLLKAYDTHIQNIYESKNQKGLTSNKEDILSITEELDGLREYESLLKGYVDQWKNPKEVVAALENILKKNVQSPLLFMALAEGFIQLKKPEKALELTKQAITLSPNIAYFYDVQGTAFLLQHLPLLAKDSFSKAVSIAPSESFYKIHRGYALYLLGEKSMCSDFYQACIEGDCAPLSWIRDEGLCKSEK